MNSSSSENSNKGLTSAPETSHQIGGFRGAKQRLTSFDGGETAQTQLFAPDRYRFFDDIADTSHRIARGSGLSYSAASFTENGSTICHQSFDRILDFDSTTGEVEVEPGITLWVLFQFLVERGYYLPCHPGHGAITIGGCIAADVHGKNHVRDGNFNAQIVSLDLFHPAHGNIHLSPHENLSLFELTCGGFGLTGHILKARLKPEPIASNTVERSNRRFDNFSDTLDGLRDVQKNNDFSYSWHDMSRPGIGFGAGYVHSGNIIAQADIAPKYQGKFSPSATSLQRRLPANGVINHLTTPALNYAYQTKQWMASRKPHISLQDAVFPLHGSESYFALYGVRGFHEVQMLIPLEHVQTIVDFLEKYVKDNKLVIGLASGKEFDGTQRLLRYSGKGYNLALNLPRTKTSEKSLADLDRLLIACGGRSNLIKDSRISRATAEAFYPEIEEFRETLTEFDSKRLFRSLLSKRIAL